MSTPEPHGRRLRRGRLRFLLTVLSLSAALHGYIGLRLLPELGPGGGPLAMAWLYLGLSAVMIPAGMAARFVVRSPDTADRIGWIGALLMGLFSSLLVLTVLRDVLSLCLPDAWQHATAVLVVVLALSATLIGYFNARCPPRVVEIEVPIAGLPAPLHGFRIAQISDLHVGATIKRAYVVGVVERLNALQPDLIAVTGDLVDGSVAQLGPHVAPLAGLRARHGVYAVTGNHEYYSGAAAWIAEFGRLGLHMLMNEHVVLDHDGAALVVAGVTDYSAGQFDAAQTSDPARALLSAPAGAPRLLLAHQPRSATAAAQAGFDLQLSGHTHGGQFWPWNLFVRLQQPYTAGLHRLGRLWIYTSRGTGYWGPPKRFGAPSEITLLRLRAEHV